MPRKSILLVEDRADTREAMRTLLELEGYRVACVANGQEALDYLHAADSPSLILLDLNMPVMDGRQFCREQQRDPALATVPVVLLSGEDQLPEIAASLGVAYFSKLLAFKSLLHNIRLLAS